MSRSKILLSVLVVLLGTAVIAVGVIMWQSQQDDPNPQTQSEPTTPELTANEQTALEAARIMTTWDPATDYNRTAAEQRASHLMTDERANNIVAPERAASGDGWIEAAEHNATSHPSVEVNRFTDTEEQTVSVFATWQWVTESGETLPSDTEERIYYFSFTEHGEIYDYTYETVHQRQPPEDKN